MNKLLAEKDPKKLLELKKKFINLTHSIYDLPEPNRNFVLNHIKMFSKKTNQLHIITDIDDTIYPSRFGGSDLTFKNHIVYPGVLSFYQHIATTGFVTLLTARPKSLYSDTAETVSKAIGKPVDVLYGLFRDLNPGIGIDIIKRLFQPLIPSVRSHPKKIEHIDGSEPIKWYSTYNDMAKTKFLSILKYTTVYPEFNFIFIGDSGQGDMICAYHIYEHKKKNPNFPVKASFIHNIIKSKDLKPVRMIQDQTFITELQKRNIYLFNNYIDLAGQLYSLDLIKKDVLDKIIDETIIDFKENKKDSIYDKDPNYISYIETELNESASFFRKQKDI
jgi:hypothetical protein